MEAVRAAEAAYRAALDALAERRATASQRTAPNDPVRERLCVEMLARWADLEAARTAAGLNPVTGEPPGCPAS